MLCQQHPLCSLMYRRGRVKLSGIHRLYLGRREAQDIWIVDGARVCLTLYPDFIMGGNDQRYRFNPPDEVWIDNRIGIEELNYTIAHELRERRLMRERGWSYDRAHDEGGIVAERILRDRDERLVKRQPAHLQPFYRQYYGRRDGVGIWIVDGPAVRKHLDPDFCFGTHDLRRSFVPSGQIWLDSAMSVEEAYFALLQQRANRAARLQGASAEDAYDQAQLTVLDERVRQLRRVARHEQRLEPVHYGARERGVRQK